MGRGSGHCHTDGTLEEPTLSRDTYALCFNLAKAGRSSTNRHMLSQQYHNGVQVDVLCKYVEVVHQ